ncbi:erythromycin esterase family protein [Bacillus changyiensis]|uniref:erythromycin esterase family protein n=1 Tax=Bacillus changyiensis TaxID=3004103 RepID=UPI0022E435E7|nr:erythromycin esterase family protein [Bacillus changyiensis]MDA1478056.1 erythromycin esterase family protein [Bacillus changyiensis]
MNQEGWTKENVHEINDQLESFSFLDQYLQNKRIVFLGENGHGVAQHSQLKVRMIQYLHEQLGFNHILFESGLGECSYFNDFEKTLEPEKVMKKTIFPVWHTDEVLQLFKYLKKSHLHLSGIDIQFSSRELIFSKKLVDMMSKLDPSYSEKVWIMENDVLALDKEKRGRAYFLPFYRRNIRTCRTLKNAYKELLNFLDQHEEEITNHIPETSYFQIIRRVIAKRIDFISMLSHGMRKALQIRDQAMADNLKWYVTNMYPDEKVIIWAHNGHIAKNIKNIIGFRSIGSYLPESIKTQSYRIGMFMYEGSAAHNNREVYEVKKPPQHSIEQYMASTHLPISFLDLTSPSNHGDSMWIHDTITAMDGGLGEMTIKPSGQYDGLVLVKSVTPPTYI